MTQIQPNIQVIILLKICRMAYLWRSVGSCWRKSPLVNSCHFCKSLEAESKLNHTKKLVYNNEQWKKKIKKIPKQSVNSALLLYSVLNLTRGLCSRYRMNCTEWSCCFYANTCICINLIWHNIRQTNLFCNCWFMI